MKLVPPLIQIAGVIDHHEATMLVACGVQLLGFPLRLPVHREDLEEPDAARIIRNLPAGVSGVLITYLDAAAEIDGLARYLGAPIVQLHGDVTLETLKGLRQRAPDLAIIKSLVVGPVGADQLEARMHEFSPWVDAFITDTFDPRTGATGATGLTHDWSVSRRIVAASTRPVILAGGLTPENVAEAIHFVRPAGVDSHTGVEDHEGRKSRDRVVRFVEAATRAFAAVASH